MDINDTIAWPTPTADSRPWTRWWWLGSAVSETEITRHLERFHRAGIGGVEISPIYGATGYEDRAVPFLSPRWVALFGHTLREATRLGMGVDLITGTGWPFGGPWVKGEDAARKLLLETFVVSGSGETSPGPIVRSATKPEAERLAVSLVTADGTARDISGQVDAEGRVAGAVPLTEEDKIYALFLAPTGQQVKRAAPGGEGSVFDHFSAAATRRYTTVFDRAFASLSEGEKPRCFFNDSWEVYGANATPEILSEFQRRRGYDLRAHLHHLSGDGDPDTARRVRADYRETIGNLVRDRFLQTWAGWARGRGSKSRNQAHGSPGNLLDLYAAVDIPETEIFGPPRLKQGGLESLADVPPDFGEEEEMLVCKMASSAAHVTGKPFCSSESFTWLGEHGKVPLEHARAEADTLFVLGINHIFFHGTPFSPEDVEWPGWLFYASTHFGPTNPFWRDLPAFTAYLTRCQTLLQSGLPDNEVLFYFPFHDLLAGNEGARDLLPFLAVHRTAGWLRGNLPVFTQAARTLWERGWGYDLVSDRQLGENIEFASGHLTARVGGARYRVLLVAGCRLAPPETLERIITLARTGATILALGGLPEDVPGLGALDERRGRLRAARESLGRGEEETGSIRRFPIGQGEILTGPDVEALLARAVVPRETLLDAGIEFVRRRDGGEGDGARTYFLANPGRQDYAGWATLACRAASATLLDPMTGTGGAATMRTDAGGRTQVYLALAAGESRFLRVSSDRAAADLPASPNYAPAESSLPLQGPWSVEFIEGGPALPPPRTLAALTDWTTWKDDSGAVGAGPLLAAFSGTARYRLTFDAPAITADAWALDLGKVCHSARVRLNSENVGTLFARPFRLTLDAAMLRDAGNILEIEVTNLMANRLADLERRRGADWRPFLLVNIHYKPFDAALWEPLPSGLLGPVCLVPLRRAAL